MKILLAGLGSIGRRHLDNLAKIGIKDIIIYRRSGMGGDNFNFPVYNDLDLALAQKPDAVLITNPTALHIPTAIKAARAGAHLFIEKPLSHNLEGVDELLKITEEKKLITFVGYQFRFHPALLKIKEILSSGTFGKIIFGRVEVGQYLPDWHPGEDYRQSFAARADLGGGVILTLIHEIDYLSWFLGEPEKVNCTAGHYSDLEINVEDLAEITIQYKNNIIGQCHLDYLQKKPARHLKIVCERGEIFWDYFENKIKISQDGKEAVIYEDNDFDRNQMFLSEMENFIACVNGFARPPVDVPGDLKILKLALAAKLSAEKNKTIDVAENNFLENFFHLKGKTVLITGGTGLLGKEYARAFLSCGSNVVLADIDDEKLKQTQEEFSEEFGRHILCVRTDVSKKVDVEILTQKILERFGKIDILVNNAGVSGKFASDNVAPIFENYPQEQWDKAWAVNVTGMFLCAQIVGREMVKSGGGTIINVSSIHGIISPDQRMYNKEGELKFVKPVSYSVTKSAILNLTRYLATYWADKNIRVNTLTPGGVFDNQDPEFVKKYGAKTPLGRMANPGDMVGPMLFLASDASSYMTGANLVVDGGWTAW